MPGFGPIGASPIGDTGILGGDGGTSSSYEVTSVAKYLSDFYPDSSTPRPLAERFEFEIVIEVTEIVEDVATASEELTASYQLEVTATSEVVEDIAVATDEQRVRAPEFVMSEASASSLGTGYRIEYVEEWAYSWPALWMYSGTEEVEPEGTAILISTGTGADEAMPVPGPVVLESTATASELAVYGEGPVTISDASADESLFAQVDAEHESVTVIADDAMGIADHLVNESASAYAETVCEGLALLEDECLADNLLLIEPVVAPVSEATASELTVTDEYNYPANPATALAWSASSGARAWIYDPTFGQSLNGSMRSGGANKVMNFDPLPTASVITFNYFQPQTAVIIYEIVGVTTPTALVPARVWGSVTVDVPAGAVLRVMSSGATTANSYVEGVWSEEPGVTSSIAWAFESVVATTPVLVEDFVAATSEVLDDRVTTAVSFAAASSSTTVEVAASSVLVNTAVVTDSTFGVEERTEEEVVSCADEHEVVILNSLVLELATAIGEVVSGTVSTAEVLSAGVATDAVSAAVDTAHTDYSTAYSYADAGAGVDATEYASVESALLVSVVSGNMLYDAAGAFGELITANDATNVEEGFGVADDKAIFSRPDLTAWVMNTETASVAWYSNWGFTDMATMPSGRTLAVGPEGMMLLGGNTDAGEKINASVVFDRTDFGGYGRDGRPLPDEPKKRIAGIYAGYRSTGELEVTLESWGPQYGAHKYRMQTHAFENHRNARVVPGKGLVSRYWKLSIGNVDGCNFDIVSMSADIARSQRRI